MMREKIQRDGSYPKPGQRDEWKREKKKARETKPEPPKPADPEPDDADESEDRPELEPEDQ
jgi:hypothetical protein